MSGSSASTVGGTSKSKAPNPLSVWVNKNKKAR
jgi:hypothetical protein